MVESYNPENKPFPFSKDQIKLALKALDTILPQVEQALAGPSEEVRNIYLSRVLKLPVLKEIFETEGIDIKDEPEVIQKKLQALARKLKTEETRVIIEPAEPEVVEVTPSVPESARDTVMNIQADLNELYKNRDYALAEIPKIEEALVRLTVFATDIPKNEKVQVMRTPDGTIEVIFESDVVEAETLAAEAEDIRLSQKRIAVYEEEKEKGKPKGFFAGLFSGKEEISPEAMNWENKMMRTNEELAARMRTYEARNERLQVRLKNKKEALETILTVTGTDTFVDGTWGELSNNLWTGAQRVISTLNKDIARYDQAINSQEEKRQRAISEGQ